MKSLLLASALLASSGFALAKLPPPPPVDPAKAEEAKQKEAAAKAKGAELQAKYEDKAVAAKDGLKNANHAMLDSAHRAASSLSAAVAAARTKLAQAIEPKKVVA